MSEAAPLDETDLAILDFLSENARISNREVAFNLGLAEGTVRARIRRMTEEKSIRFTALTRELDVETPTLCYVGLRVDLPALSGAAKALADFAEVRFVATTLGRYDVLAIVIVDSAEGLTRLVNDKIMSIPGVRRSHTSIATNTLKYDHRWGKVI